MARPSQYDAQAVIRGATAAFWRNGYQRTGVRELLAATGCNRRGLYERFGGKEGLFAAALNDYRARYIDAIIELLHGPTAGLPALRELFDVRLNNHPERGCLVLNTIGEKTGIDAHLYELAREQQKRIELGVRHCVEVAQSSGDITSDRNPVVLVRYIMILLHGIAPASRGGMVQPDLTALADQAIEFLRN